MQWGSLAQVVQLWFEGWAYWGGVCVGGGGVCVGGGVCALEGGVGIFEFE